MKPYGSEEYQKGLSEYIEGARMMLRVDLACEGQQVEYGILSIQELSYQQLDKPRVSFIDDVVSQAQWLENYFGVCAYRGRPLDMELVNYVIDSLGYTQGICVGCCIVREMRSGSEDV